MDYGLFIDKYQPNSFNELEIDNDIVKLLKVFIEIDSLNILFVGQPSSGKTLLLNILIKEYYKDVNDYEENILRINNLKEQGINYFRNDVKIFCQTCSNIKNKKKIIMIDDLDLITDQSQQIIKNCLDKYSYNVNFIFSCGNMQKIDESLQSRLNIIKLKLLEKHEIKKIIKKIKTNENIIISEEVEDFLLNISNNLLKVIINYMEKFKLLEEEITMELFMKLYNTISFYDFDKYTELIKNNNLNDAIKLLYNIHEKGYSILDILDSYFLYIKNTTFLTEEEKYIIIPCICKYISIFYGMNEEQLELALFSNELNQQFILKTF